MNKVDFPPRNNRFSSASDISFERLCIAARSVSNLFDLASFHPGIDEDLFIAPRAADAFDHRAPLGHVRTFTRQSRNRHRLTNQQSNPELRLDRDKSSLFQK